MRFQGQRFAIKVSPGFFDNPTLGLPSLNGMMILLSARTGLLDALLAEQPEARWDARFERARERLRQFQGIAPADPPSSEAK